MKIMPYGSLWVAEKDSGPGCDFQVTDDQWDVVTRSLRRYEEGVHRYFGRCPDGRVCVGDSYIMYESGLRDIYSGYYSGVRLGKKKGVRSPWLSVYLSDRDKEADSFNIFGSFDLAWKHFLRGLVWLCF
ncbi:hypothetical protein V5S96_08005 [Corynebacterium mastitidis]|uniref:Uncharacterized protein n=1 Tax=Corynebacterium mastitidis TaxID=161890 RepID=A0ABU8P215_9CORY